MQRQLAQVVVAPLRRLAARHLAAGRHVVPAVRAVVDGVQEQALVLRVLRQVRRREQRARDRQAGLEQQAPVLGLALQLEPAAEAQQPLRGDRGRRRVDRLVVVEGVGRLLAVPRHRGEPRRARVPVRDAVDRRREHVVGGDGPGGLEEEAHDLGAAAERLELGVAHRLEELQLLREAEEDPRLAAGPRRERRVALLRARAPVAAVHGVEQALVRHAPALVPGVAAAALEDGEARGRARVEDDTLEERRRPVALLEEGVAEPVREGHARAACAWCRRRASAGR